MWGLIWGGGVITTPRVVDSLGWVWVGGWWAGGWLWLRARPSGLGSAWGVWDGRVAGGMVVVGVMCEEVDMGGGGHYDP